MRPGGNRTPDELLKWAMLIVAREQSSGLFGTIQFHFENGVITRCLTQRSELPTLGLDRSSKRD